MVQPVLTLAQKIVTLLRIALAVVVTYGDKVVILVGCEFEIVHLPRFADVVADYAIEFALRVNATFGASGINGVPVRRNNFEPPVVAENFV